MRWTWRPWPQRGFHRTRSFPFGTDVDTLIVCRNEEVRLIAIEALRLKAQYETYYSSLSGHRFDKIIVIPPYWVHCSEKEQQIFQDLVNDYLPTKLKTGGTLHVL